MKGKMRNGRSPAVFYISGNWQFIERFDPFSATSRS
jgi:hypothetical protein